VNCNRKIPVLPKYPFKKGSVYKKQIFFDVPIVMVHQVTLPQDPTYHVSDLDSLDTRMDKELLHFGKAEIKT
jgi:hypothetical protein